MFRYSGYSLVIGSEIDLPGLPVSNGEPDILIRYGKVARVSQQKATPTDEVAFHPLAGAFHIRNGREIIVDPLPGASPEALRILLMGRMLAYLLRQRGWLPLHASGSMIAGQGVLFLGATGAGKSTTAAALNAQGHPVITDDVGAVRAIGKLCIGLAGRPRLRLDANSRSILKPHAHEMEWDWDKYALDASERTLPANIEIRQIYLLTDGGEIGTRAVPRSNSVKILSEHCFFRRRKVDADSLRMHLSDCAAVAALVSVRELIRPRDLHGLPALARFLEQEMANRV